jgi:hypothetical protein
MIGLRALDLVILGAMLVGALAGTVTALGGRGGDTAVLLRDGGPSQLSAAAVERVLRSAPEPGSGRGRGNAATCRSRGAGALRNPWTCRVSYASGRRALVRVQVKSDGSYLGRYRGGGETEGCCIAVPGAG